MQPQDYRLFVLVDGPRFQLAGLRRCRTASGLPAAESEPQRDFPPCTGPWTAAGMWRPPCLVVRRPSFLLSPGRGPSDGSVHPGGGGWLRPARTLDPHTHTQTHPLTQTLRARARVHTHSQQGCPRCPVLAAYWRASATVAGPLYKQRDPWPQRAPSRRAGAGRGHMLH